jgi:hypothetical protein
MSITAPDDVYDRIASSIKNANPPKLLEDKDVGKPLLKFIIDRAFSRTAQLVAYEFAVDFYQLSGTQILNASVQDGCISVQLRLESHLDCFGNDLRHAFVSRRAFHELFYKYDVKTIHLSGFPNISNFDATIQIGREGMPFNQL